jgi:hypothetical protein
MLAVALLTLLDAAGVSAAPARAPSRPALNLVAPGVTPGEEEGMSESGAGDPLVSNGLGSPLCRSRAPEAALTANSRRDCVTSGFVASAAPTTNYGLDVHIDTGVLGLSQGGLMSALQDLLVTPLWMALVWVVHALCVMLEWSFALNLLDSPVSGGVGSGLRHMQQALTDPWIPAALAIACVLVVYDGLIRRRVADTLSQALVMIAMMAAGLWAIADPSGTVGALGSWANEASQGTLAVASRGTPAGSSQALGQGTQVVFSAAIEVPWCYLEFGDVQWCRDPGRTEARLRSAGLKIAAEELSLAGCGPHRARPGDARACSGGASVSDRSLVNSAQLLHEADSNGAFFLALPANGPQRNSINDEGSLLRTICQSSDATDCHGPAAAEAEFRTGGQTWSRLAGLLLIVVGALGMILLLGFIALRLLSAALFSLFYLLIAPGMVLAPALGEGGRAVFRRWATHLLGAVISKLLFSFLLGVVLAVLAILADLHALGWWTQWLLMSAFWWGAYLRRHQALGFAETTFSRAHVERRAREPRSLARRTNDAIESRKGSAVIRWAKGRLDGDPPERTDDRPQRRPLSSWLGEAAKIGRSSMGHPPTDPSQRQTEQLARVLRERDAAASAGDRRRAVELAARATRIEGEMEVGDMDTDSHRTAGAGASRPAAHRAATAAVHRTPPPYWTPEMLERRRKANLSIDREIREHRERLEQDPDFRPDPYLDSSEAVMDDIREVEAGRKKYLGFGNP